MSNSETAFWSDYSMATTVVQDDFTAVEVPVDTFGKENVLIICKCEDVIENKTRQWLAGNDFYLRTRYDPWNLHFCTTRAEEVPLAKKLGITNYIDNHANVL